MPPQFRRRQDIWEPGISIADDNTISADEGALLLLFPPGQRPTTDVLRQVASETERLAVTATLGESAHAHGAMGIEVLRDGMTYDLIGAAPGPAVALPPLRHRLGVARDLQLGSALALQPGPHLAAGSRTLPVVRTMIRVAVMTVSHFPGLRALAWAPARTLIGLDFFISTMTAWLAGGAFPALGLTAFDRDPGGGVRSEGLAFFTGQEIHILPEVASDPMVATRLGVRLMNQLVGQTRIAGDEAILGPDGDRLVLEPASNGTLVRVRRA